MVAGAVWTNLKDPDDSDLATVLPKRPHQIAVERLSQTEKYIEEAFPSLESHKSDSTDTYLFGELAFPVFDPEAESIGTISVRLVVDFDRLVTVMRTPEGLPPGVAMPDLSDLPSPGSDLEAGACMWLLLDRVAREIRDLVKAAEVRAEQVSYDGEPIQIGFNPQFVIDAPGGGGKIPLNPDYVVRSDERNTLLRNYEGKEFLYPEAQELGSLLM